MLPISITQVVTLLTENPPRIAALTASLTSPQLRATPGPGEWSANDVLAHLRCCADVWGGYIRKMIDQDGPCIRAISPRGWINRTDYRDLEFEPSFRAFAAQAVLSYAERLAAHERHHLEHFARIANARRA